ncbi:MAG: thioredoxin family protein [Bacteroidetes bacterium]|nr:thioredoxin family protein [Bacteroidota bacterium]
MTSLIKLLMVFSILGVGARFSALSQQINWVSFEKLPALMRENPKYVMVFIHTDWCKYCEMQEKNTFRNPEIVEKVNKYFYAIRLNAEEDKKIAFLNRTYEKSANEYHALAEQLGKENGVLTFPTTTFLAPYFNHLGNLVGFANEERLEEALKNVMR